MNDNTPQNEDDLPAWAWDILDQHDLGDRADSALSAVTVLLTDAAADLKELSLTVFREQAVSAATLHGAAACAAMLADVITLAALCPTEPQAGAVTEADDGTLTWRAADPE